MLNSPFALEEPGTPMWLPGSPARRYRGGRPRHCNGVTIAFQISPVDWSIAVYVGGCSRAGAAISGRQQGNCCTGSPSSESKGTAPARVLPELRRIQAVIRRQLVCSAVHRTAGMLCNRSGSEKLCSSRTNTERVRGRSGA